MFVEAPGAVHMEGRQGFAPELDILVDGSNAADILADLCIKHNGLRTIVDTRAMARTTMVHNTLNAPLEH